MRRAAILLIGPDGQVGWELRRALAPLAPLLTAGMTGGDHALNLAEPGQIAPLLRRLRPALVVNAAAHTAVDRAESEPELAYRINAEAVGAIGAAAAELGCPVLHYSTDYIFSGDSDTPWIEDDQPGPLGAYGASKLAGEQALAASGADWLCLRTAWVYGNRGQNFLRTMLRLFGERDALNIVSDQIGAPTWSRLIAQASALILAQCRMGTGFAFGERGGLYHLTCGGETSWHGFASAIRDEAGSTCQVSPIPSSAYPTPAARPRYSVLDNGLLESRFGLRLPDWREALALCMAERRECRLA
jgi:dTDP-4-dehydrorhamnose reductase